MRLLDWLTALLRYVFPSRCLHCGKPLYDDKQDFCNAYCEREYMPPL